MAWSVPYVFTTGQVVTAAQMNTYISDNLSFLGALKKAGTALSALAAATDLNATYSAKAHSTANITLANTTWTNLTFNSEATNGWDTGTIHDTGSNTQNFTLPVAGKYLVKCQVFWAAHATGSRQLRATLAGTQIGVAEALPNVATAFTQQYVDVVNATASQVVVFQAWQSSGGNLDVTQFSTYGISALVAFLGV